MTPSTPTTTVPENFTRVLTLYPFARGFAYAVLEGPDRLIYWAIKESRAEICQHVLRQLNGLLARYTPATVIIENLPANRQQARTRDLMAAMIELVREEGYPVKTLKRSQIRGHFGDERTTTKETIARQLVERFPPLRSYLPPPRRILTKADSRLHIFSAIAMGLVYFAQKPEPK